MSVLQTTAGTVGAVAARVTTRADDAPTSYRPPNAACRAIGVFSVWMAIAYKPNLWPARTGRGASRP
jgi:hypothetical protein